MMLIGRDYRVLGRNLWVAVAWQHFVYAVAVIAIFATLPDRYALAVTLVLMSVQTAIGLAIQTVHGLLVDQSRKIWADTLTDRIFMTKLIEAFRNREWVEASRLYEDATHAAVADVKKADEENDPGKFFGTQPGAAFAAVGKFLWLLAMAIVWTGFLAWLGTLLKS